MSGGGGGGQAQTTQTTQMQLPAWLDSYAQDTAEWSRKVAGREHAPYPGETVAGFSPDTYAAQSAIRGQQGQVGNFLTGLAGQAQGMAGYQPQQVQTGTLPQTDLSGYMNPYIAQVEQGALQNIDTARQMAGKQIDDRAIGAGAYGGSRFAIQQSLNDQAAMQQAGQMSAQLRQAGFNNAQQMAQMDLARQLQAGMFNSQQGLQAQNLGMSALGLAGQLGQGAQQANYTDFGALAGIGQDVQGLDQRRLDDAYARWQDVQNYPVQQLGIMQSTLQGTPYGQTQTSVSSQPLSRANPAMGALGGAASGASMGSVAGPWGMAAGAAAGGLLGYLGTRR